MSGEFAVCLTPDAAAQIVEADVWWRGNRLSAPDALTDEVEEALADLNPFPDSGQLVSDTRLEGVRRVYIKRIHYHLYFRVVAERR